MANGQQRSMPQPQFQLNCTVSRPNITVTLYNNYVDKITKTNVCYSFSTIRCSKPLYLPLVVDNIYYKTLQCYYKYLTRKLK